MRQITFSSALGRRFKPRMGIFQIIFRAFFQQFLSVLFGQAAENHHRNIFGFSFAFQVPQHFRAGHLGKIHIQQNQVRMPLLRHLQRGFAIFGANHLVPRPLQCPFVFAAEGLAVLH
jgi:hypothetical protein